MTDRTFITISTEMPPSISMAGDIALTAISRARLAVQTGHFNGESVCATFLLANVYCAVFATPSGQLRYQVGPCGKPARNSAGMVRVLTDAIREAQVAAGEYADFQTCLSLAGQFNKEARDAAYKRGATK